MSAAVISTLIFASPGASAFSGSRTDSPFVAPPGSRAGEHVQEVRDTTNPSADFWRSGSRTDSAGGVEGSVGQSADTGHRAIDVSGKVVGLTADPSADYWHALATKRLKIIGKRERRIVALLVRIHKLRARDVHRRYAGGRVGSPANIICSVFGSHCSEAIHVAQCESTLNVYARNGDYEGLFQFGSFARAHYGFAWDALTQARAAYRYWRDAGWSPWQCQP